MYDVTLSRALMNKVILIVFSKFLANERDRLELPQGFSTLTQFVVLINKFHTLRLYTWIQAVQMW